MVLLFFDLLLHLIFHKQSRLFYVRYEQYYLICKQGDEGVRPLAELECGLKRGWKFMLYFRPRE